MSDTLLTVKDLKTYFFLASGVSKAVDGVSFELKKGETMGIVGESGSGKSVSSSSIIRLLPPRTGKIVGGEINFDGKDVLKLNKKELLDFRGKDIAVIFQDPMTSLDPVFKIGNQMVEMICAHQDVDKKTAWNMAVEALNKVGIPQPEKRMEAYPYELSGGMCQRVMIAMAMSCEPELLIADEPTTALDVTIQAQILELMEEIREKKNTGILMITHDLGVVAEMCSRVVVMYAGRIVEEAPVKELFSAPKHPYTQGLIASVPKLGSGVESLPSIPGSVPDLSVMPKGCKFAPRCKYATDICREKEPELMTVEGIHKCRCHHMNDLGKEA